MLGDGCRIETFDGRPLGRFGTVEKGVFCIVGTDAVIGGGGVGGILTG